MTEEAFLKIISKKATEMQINPILLLSGFEGLYTFREMPLNTINYDFLDSLILTIFALRIGDKFHEHAQQNLASNNPNLRDAAARELKIISPAEIEASGDPYLLSFARIINGKSPVRTYHLKALEAAALEINNVQLFYKSKSISTVMLYLWKEFQDELDLGILFGKS